MEDDISRPEQTQDGESHHGASQGARHPRSDDIRRILHDLDQPLTAITNYAQAGVRLLDNDAVDPARLKDLFDKINEQCRRTRAISQALRQTVTGQEDSH